MFEDIFKETLKEHLSEFCIEWELVDIRFFDPFFEHSSSFAMPSPFRLFDGKIIAMNVLKPPESVSLDKETILQYSFTYSMIYELRYENGRDTKLEFPIKSFMDIISSKIGDIFNNYLEALNQRF